MENTSVWALPSVRVWLGNRMEYEGGWAASTDPVSADLLTGSLQHEIEERPSMVVHGDVNTWPVHRFDKSKSRDFKVALRLSEKRPGDEFHCHDAPKLIATFLSGQKRGFIRCTDMVFGLATPPQTQISV